MPSGYELLDSGDGRKLERFGDIRLVRPCGQAVWRPALPEAVWRDVAAGFDRREGNRWHDRHHLPEAWEVEVEGIAFRLSSTDFGHLGIFPEQRAMWRWLRDAVAGLKAGGQPVRVLNAFAYSGGSTLAAAQSGAEVCHLDASKGMVEWARVNAGLNRLSETPIRWIVDDAVAFLRRELKRARRYEGLVLDPPSFGRGRKGELFKIQQHLPVLLELCRELLSDTPAFVLLSCHTPEYSPGVLHNLLRQTLADRGGDVEAGEMFLTGGPGVLPLPSGSYARWTA